MKFLIGSMLFLSLSAFAQVEIKSASEAKILKVSEVTIQTQCKDVSGNSSDNTYYDCKVGTIKSFLNKKLGTVVRMQAMDSDSQSVLSNSVDNEGEYTVRLRAFFY